MCEYLEDSFINILMEIRFCPNFEDSFFTTTEKKYISKWTHDKLRILSKKINWWKLLLQKLKNEFWGLVDRKMTPS